jgi:aminoglycoside phosphotransferase family enzyme
MDYDQKNLIELFKLGVFPGETCMPKHIETFISNVFVFEKKVYKFYKNNNSYFNENFRDISSKGKRFDFTSRDFKWNNAMSPSIYTELIGVSVSEDMVQVVNPDENAEELVIKMNRVDLSDILFEKLAQGKITKEDAFAIGKGLGESLAKVRTPLPDSYNYYEVFGRRIADAKSWMSSEVESISADEIDSYCDLLLKFREEHKELFVNDLSNQMAYGGDIHSHNALYSKGEFFLMDTFSPKDDWLIEYHAIPAYRIGTDIWAMSGDEDLFNECLKGYEESSGLKIDRSLDSLFVLYALTIATPYHYMLAKNDVTKKEAVRSFHDFMHKYSKDLK